MMTIKSILVPFGGSDEELNALNAAFNLAKIFNSNVRVLYISPDPRAVFEGYYTGDAVTIDPVPANIKKSLEKLNRANQRAAKDKYLTAVKKSGIDYNEDITPTDKASASFKTEIGIAEDIVAFQGRLADLIVMGKTIQDVNTDFAGSLISALFDTGKPVLIIPTENLPEDIDLRVVIAWNGSAQAARAVSDAMPLLQRSAHATKVWVLTDGDGKKNSFSVMPEELCLYLKQHEIDADPISIKDKGFTTPVAILNEAKNLNAGMIVMGGFSHSRLREMIFGGVTDFILKNTNIPVFMSH